MNIRDFVSRQRRPGSEPRRQRRQRGESSQKRLVGLKIGASQVAAAQVLNNGAAELVQVARAELAPGVVVGGELQNPEALAPALADFFAAHKLPRQDVRLGIASNRIGVRAFDLEGIDDPRQLENAIRFRAQEVLPIPIHEAMLDYQVLSESVGNDGQLVRRILIIVAYRELIDRYVSACTQAGIELAGVDLEAFALLRALAAPPEEGSLSGALVAVSVGHERSTFAISDRGVCEFTRVLDWGGAALDRAIARELGLAPSDAEPIKRSLSVLRDDATAGLTRADADRARDAIGLEIQSFARDLISSLQFYQSQPGSLGIAEIALTGGTAHLDGLAERLEQLVGVTVRIGNPLARVRHSAELAADAQLGSLSIAIGLGIED
jgi:type IV pilus assembly protein PilM